MFACIDRQTNNWKKAKVDNKDKRIKLRKALPGETNAVKPPDVLALAETYAPANRPVVISGLVQLFFNPVDRLV